MKNRHIYKDSIQKNNYTVINCRSCGYWHVYPVPEKEALNTYYKSKYFMSLGDNPSMADKINDRDGFYRLQYEDRLRCLEKSLPHGLPKTIIDIGSGYGDFLKFMKKKDWHVQGVEPSKYTCGNRKNKAFNVKSITVDELPRSGLEASAVVTLNNILEHLRDPQEVLDNIKNTLLLPQGIIFIIVPNDFNILQELLMKTVLKKNPKKQYYWVCPPDHLN